EVDHALNMTGRKDSEYSEHKYIALLIDRPKVFRFKNVGDGVDVAAQRPPLKAQRVEQALAAGGVNRVIHGVVGDRRRDSARTNPAECRWPGEATELNSFKQNARVVGEWIAVS